MDVYDVRWVTNFEEKMAEMTGNSNSKKGEYTVIYIFNVYSVCIFVSIQLFNDLVLRFSTC